MSATRPGPACTPPSVRTKWFEFGDNVLVKASGISYAALDGRTLVMVVDGVARAILSADLENARTRYELIRSEMGFS